MRKLFPGFTEFTLYIIFNNFHENTFVQNSHHRKRFLVKVRDFWEKSCFWESQKSGFLGGLVKIWDFILVIIFKPDQDWWKIVNLYDQNFETQPHRNQRKYYQLNLFVIRVNNCKLGRCPYLDNTSRKLDRSQDRTSRLQGDFWHNKTWELFGYSPYRKE